VTKDILMDFSYSPRLLELKASAASLTERLMTYEDQCETRGGLSAEQLESVRRSIIACGLQAFNMPAEIGGAGLSNLEQVIVQEELGKLTNGLWDVVWRPANVLLAGTQEQRARWLLPCIDGRRREAVAITEPAAGSSAL
jgi:acyl-CoA dehydrogenase